MIVLSVFDSISLEFDKLLARVLQLRLWEIRGNGTHEILRKTGSTKISRISSEWANCVSILILSDYF